MKRHMREDYLVEGEGLLSFDDRHEPTTRRPSTTAELRKFRFSRLGPQGQAPSEATRAALAEAMVTGPSADSADPAVPAGYTYLGQFVDHDLTMDNTAAALGEEVSVEELLQGRSPALDLDSLYGRGPGDRTDRVFYTADGVHLKVGRTAAVAGDDATNQDRDGFDLPRSGLGSSRRERRAALIPDARNDENLAVAQTHLAFIRFHNRVADQLAEGGLSGTALFRAARSVVVRHYQWMLVTDFLPRIASPQIVDEVFGRGRRFFEVSPGYGRRQRRDRTVQPGDRPTMPIEFSVAAYRLGHSMIREEYDWNRVFNTSGAPGVLAPGTLELLFQFSGTSGILSPDGDTADPESGSFERLPTNWIADFRRLYDFTEAGRDDLVALVGDEDTEQQRQLNLTRRIDTRLVDPLRNLPPGSFGGGTGTPAIELNLAFRNLTRAVMVRLASGQQMAQLFDLVPLKPDEILGGLDGAVLDGLTDEQKTELTTHTPLWFYILREAEFNGGRLDGVGARILAEVFHRAIEGSRISILRDPTWRPTLGPDDETFRMVDLLLYAFDGSADLLNPLG